jgi:type II secretory pathway component GspD/PulD (secretin)
MRKVSFILVGSALCGLVMAVLYLAYAQENDGNDEDQAADAAQTEIAAASLEAPNSESTPSASLQPVNGAPAANGNGRKTGPTIELAIGGNQATNVMSGVTLEGGNATNLITIALDGVPVQDVVSMFAQISGANIITAGSFTNIFVTANLKNVEWKTALNLALGSVNLAVIEDLSGILMVVTSEMYKQKLQQIEETKPLITRTFTPKYLRAVDLVEQIKLLRILSPRGIIITSQSKEQDKVSLKSTGNATEAAVQNPSITTSIIVSDIKEYVDKVGALIAQLDRREPQVFIEARIIDVGYDYSQKLGFDWEMLDRFGVTASMKDASWNFTDNRTETTTTDNRDYMYDKRNNNDGLNKRYDMHGQEYEESTTTYEESPPGSGNWVARTVVTPTRTLTDTINRGRELTSDNKDTVVDAFSEGKMGTMILSVSDVSLFLSALRRNTDMDILSHPVLIVGNRVEAKIHVGEQTWRISLKRDTTNTGSAPMDRYSEDAAPIDLGLKLWVIPEIDVENDAVRMTIEPEMTVFIRNITTAQGSVYPVTSTRRLSTRVNVPNSHTVVIGGLVENKKGTAEKRVPLLGDIPLIGMLFRHTEDTDTKHNLLIMLSPTILDERKPLTGMEAIAQLTVNKFEQNPRGAIKNVPPNQPPQSPAADVNTPSSGAAAATPAPASAATPAPVAVASPPGQSAD